MNTFNVSDVRHTRKHVELNCSGTITFDPYDYDHRQSFLKMMAAGRQSDLRFNTEGFDSVPSMMMFKMSVAGAKAMDTMAKFEASKPHLASIARKA